MKKFHLLDDLDEDLNFFITTLQLSSVENYLFLFRLNTQLNLNFKRIEDLENFSNNEFYQHAQYESINEITGNQYKIISNVSNPKTLNSEEGSLFPTQESKTYLLPNFKNYQLLIKTDYPLNEDFLLHLQANSDVQHYRVLNFKEFDKLPNLIA